MKIPRSAVLLIFIVFSGPGVAAFCKWVDESGAVHYAETCPEDVDSTEIETQALPSQEQVEDAIRGLEQLQEKRKVQREFKNQQAEKKAAEKQQLRAEKGAQTELCVKAIMNLAALGQPGPDYYDEAGELHNIRSSHSEWYEGDRRFLTYFERRNEFMHWVQVNIDNCDPVVDSKSGEKKLHELYGEKNQQAECQYRRAQLAKLEEPRRRTPKSEIEVVKKLILKWCH